MSNKKKLKPADLAKAKAAAKARAPLLILLTRKLWFERIGVQDGFIMYANRGNSERDFKVWISEKGQHHQVAYWMAGRVGEAERAINFKTIPEFLLALAILATEHNAILNAPSFKPAPATADDIRSAIESAPAAPTIEREVPLFPAMPHSVNEAPKPAPAPIKWD